MSTFGGDDRAPVTLPAGWTQITSPAPLSVRDFVGLHSPGSRSYAPSVVVMEVFDAGPDLASLAEQSIATSASVLSTLAVLDRTETKLGDYPAVAHLVTFTLDGRNLSQLQVVLHTPSDNGDAERTFTITLTSASADYAGWSDTCASIAQSFVPWPTVRQ